MRIRKQPSKKERNIGALCMDLPPFFFSSQSLIVQKWSNLNIIESIDNWDFGLISSEREKESRYY